MNLLSQHLEDLRGSGLSDEMIEANQAYSETDGAKINEILKWKSGGDKLGPCLVFPYFEGDGVRIRGYERVKPDVPRKSRKKDDNGKAIKYESPLGLPNRAYFANSWLGWNVRGRLSEPSTPVIITEGEKKTLKAVQEGFVCVGLIGVWGWVHKRPKGPDGKARGRKELIPDLAGIYWEGRQVSIIYDSDAAQNDKVKQAEECLARVLTQQGAAVKIVRLPELTEGESK